MNRCPECGGKMYRLSEEIERCLPCSVKNTPAPAPKFVPPITVDYEDTPPAPKTKMYPHGKLTERLERQKATGRKRCSHCKMELALSKFARSKSNKDGLNNQCRDCHRDSMIRMKKRKAGKLQAMEDYHKAMQSVDP